MFEAYLSGRQLAAARTVISGMSQLRDIIDSNGHLSEAELKKRSLTWMPKVRVASNFLNLLTNFV